eukprot:955880-Rhodomonas_salina.1
MHPLRESGTHLALFCSASSPFYATGSSFGRTAPTAKSLSQVHFLRCCYGMSGTDRYGMSGTDLAYARRATRRISSPCPPVRRHRSRASGANSAISLRARYEMP